ncbi:kinase-like domain-containing protein [Rhizophagus irregularis DAOM 181602=DAOM 197198]|nr:kinase-like domain-containing protein [Rhizophagus irregularis DAOM 181602=DAOM 197198]
MYEVGIIENDDNKAFELSKKSAEGGYSGGMNLLGYYYNFGVGTDVDMQKSFELYQKAANFGNHDAQYNLALAYEYVTASWTFCRPNVATSLDFLELSRHTRLQVVRKSKRKIVEKVDYGIRSALQGQNNDLRGGRKFGEFCGVGTLRGDMPTSQKNVSNLSSCTTIPSPCLGRRINASQRSCNVTSISILVEKILVDKFKDKSRIAKFIDFEVLDTDPKELIYYISCVAEYGFDHIIIVEETDYGMIFLDCYGRVFQLDDESQFLWPLGDSPEEAQKYSTDRGELAWFVENGVIHEYIRKPQYVYPEVKWM